MASDQRRGAERVAEELHTDLLSRGWPSQLVALTHVAPGGLEVPVLGPSARSPRSLLAAWRLARDADVVAAHGSSTLDVMAAASLVPGPPVIYVNIGDPTYWLTTWAKRRRVGWALRRTHHVVAIAEQAVPLLTDWLGVDAGRVSVIRNGRDAARFSPSSPEVKAAARAELGLAHVEELVLVLGALSAEKRVDLALEAVASQPRAHVVIAGAGPERERLVRLAAGLLPGRAHFLGSVADPARVLAAADVVLLTSDTEGVPGAIVEAGLCGLPTVATDVGFVADVVVDGVTGLLVPAGDIMALSAALARVLSGPQSLGRAARERCLERYGRDQVMASWLTLLHDTADQGAH